MRQKLVLVALLSIIIVIAAASALLGLRPSVKPDTFNYINLPQGFQIDLYADNLDGSSISYPGLNPGPRMMLLKDNVLYVSITNRERLLRSLTETTIKKLMRR